MSKLETNTIDTVSGTSTLQVGSTNTSTITLGVSGDTVNVPSGVTIANSGTATGFGETNTPAFSVYKNASFDINDSTSTKVAFDTETYDTDSAFASNKFTVPSGAGGKYFFYSRVRFQKTGISEYAIFFKKNNSDVAKRYLYSGAVGTAALTADYFSYDVSCTLNLSATDYVEVFLYVNTTDGGACTVNGGSVHNEFTGYKITS